MSQVSPTRMNLLQRRGQLRLAQKGVDLLKKKRDALVAEFFGLAREAMRDAGLQTWISDLAASCGEARNIRTVWNMSISPVIWVQENMSASQSMRTSKTKTVC